MKIAVGSDHGGWELKQVVLAFLQGEGHEIVDVGCESLDSVDYPAFAFAVCERIIAGNCECGILICGTGIGMSIAANRDRRIRAALCHEPFSARMSREHNNANVLCLGGRVTGPELAVDIVRTWIAAEFTGDRHQRRIDMFS